MHPEVIRVSDRITCVRRPSYFTCSYIVDTGAQRGVDRRRGAGGRPAAPADVLVADGEMVRGFEVIATPGHTDGHAACYCAPDDALFAGDALALVDGQLRYMARRVTPDMVAARASMAKLLERDCALLCPGHRSPGPIDPADRREFRARLAHDEWPELG